MRRSYVGIASRLGLESLWPEHPHTAAFLLRRLARHRDVQAVCFWAVMAPEFAEQIWLELAAGNRQEALILLQSLATYVGRLLPEENPPVIARVD
jgi:hypothetical protein